MAFAVSLSQGTICEILDLLIRQNSPSKTQNEGLFFAQMCVQIDTIL